MKRSALERRASRTKKQEDIKKCKKQRNLVAKLNRETKLQYFNNLETSKNSNKHVNADSKIILDEKEEITTNTNEIVENETLLVTNDEIAKTFNKHFAKTLEKLNTFEWPSNNEHLTEETLTKIIKRFKKHPSIIKIKNKWVRLNYTTTHLQPKYIHHHPPLPTTSQNISNTTHHHRKNGPLPSKSQNIFIYNLLLTLLNSFFFFDTHILFRNGDFM